MRWNAPEDFQSYLPVRVSAQKCLVFIGPDGLGRWSVLECATVLPSSASVLTVSLVSTAAFLAGAEPATEA
jgi:hypothetical protein